MNLDTNKSTSIPLISVIMSVYNSEKYLVRAIESILYQTFPDFEFIVIDDGSTDRSLEIMQAYAKQDDRLRIIVNENNQGLARSLNIGIANAKGEFIARMDADDISFPDRLQKQLSFLLAHPEIMILGGSQVFIDHDGKETYALSFSNQQSVLRWNMLLGNGLIVSHPTVMIRREFLITIGGYSDLKAAQDFEIWTRLFNEKVLPIRNLDDVILYYRKHSQTITSSNRSLQEETAVKIRRQKIEYLLDHAIPEQVIFAYRNTDFQYADIKEYMLTWVEIYNRFVKHFELSKKETKPVREELSQRISNYTYFNLFNSVTKNRVLFWHMLLLFPAWLMLAVIKCKFKYLNNSCKTDSQASKLN